MSYKTKQEAFAAMKDALATLEKLNAPVPSPYQALVDKCKKVVVANTKTDAVAKKASEEPDATIMDSGEAQIQGDKIIVTANLFFYGTQATLSFCSSISCEIENMFNAPNALVCVDGKEYKVEFKFQFTVITVKEADQQIRNNTDIRNNYVRLEKKPESGLVDRSFMALGGK